MSNGDAVKPTWHFHLNYNLIYLVIIAILAASAYEWLHEHDLRVRAEEQEKASEAIMAANKKAMDTLQAQMEDVKAQRDKQVAVMQKKLEAIKTPQQAVAAMPDLTGLPAGNFRVTPLGDVEVAAPAAVTIAQQLQQGKIWKTELDACNSLYAKEQQVNTLLVSDNTELKKEKESWKKAAGHKSFLGHLWNGTKMVAPVAAAIVVIVVGHH